MSIRVKGPGFRRKGRRFNVPFPFARIGRFPSLDITIDDPQVSRWHVFLQRMPEGVFFVDLGSRNGLRYKREPCTKGWIEPDEPLWIGDYSLHFDVKNPPPLINPLARIKPADDHLQPVALTFVTAHGRSEAHPLKRRLTLVGRSSPSNLRLSDPTIARAHVAIYRTAEEAWLVNLAGASAFHAGQPLLVASLTSGGIYEIGQFNMRADLGRLIAVHSSEPLGTTVDHGDQDLFNHDGESEEVDAKVGDSISVHVDLDFDRLAPSDSSPSAIDPLELEALNRELDASRAESEHLAALLGEMNPAVTWNGRVDHLNSRRETANEQGQLVPREPLDAPQLTNPTRLNGNGARPADALSTDLVEYIAEVAAELPGDFQTPLPIVETTPSPISGPIGFPVAEATCVLSTFEPLPDASQDVDISSTPIPQEATPTEPPVPFERDSSIPTTSTLPPTDKIDPLADVERPSDDDSARILALENKIQDLEQQRQNAESRLEEQWTRVAELTARLTDTQARRDAAESTILQLRNSLDELQRELAEERARSAENADSLSRHEQTIGRMRQNQVKAAEVILERNHALETLSAKLEENEKDRKAREQKLTQLAKKLEATADSEAALAKTGRDLESRIAQLTAELRGIEELKLTADERIRSQEATIAELNGRLATSLENESKTAGRLSELERLVQEKSRQSELEHRRLVDELAAATNDLAYMRQQRANLSGFPPENESEPHESADRKPTVAAPRSAIPAPSDRSAERAMIGNPADAAWPSEEEILQAYKQETASKPESARRPDLQVAKTLLDRAKHVDPRREQLRLASWIAGGAVAILALFAALIFLGR